MALAGVAVRSARVSSTLLRYPIWAPRLSTLCTGLIGLLVVGLTYVLGYLRALDDAGKVALLLLTGVITLLLNEGISRRYSKTFEATLRMSGSLAMTLTRADGSVEHRSAPSAPVPSSKVRERLYLVAIFVLR